MHLFGCEQKIVHWGWLHIGKHSCNEELSSPAWQRKLDLSIFCVQFFGPFKHQAYRGRRGRRSKYLSSHLSWNAWFCVRPRSLPVLSTRRRIPAPLSATADPPPRCPWWGSIWPWGWRTPRPGFRPGRCWRRQTSSPCTSTSPLERAGSENYSGFFADDGVSFRGKRNGQFETKFVKNKCGASPVIYMVDYIVLCVRLLTPLGAGIKPIYLWLEVINFV